MQALPEITTPRRPLPHTLAPLKQPFGATPWLSVKQDKTPQYEINMPVDLSTESQMGHTQPNNNHQQSVRPKTSQLATHTQDAVIPAQSVNDPSYGLTNSVHISSPHLLNVPTVLSQTIMHDVNINEASTNFADERPADMCPPTTVPYSQFNSVYNFPYSLQAPAATAILPQTNVPGHRTTMQAPQLSGYGVPNTLYSKPPNLFLCPPPPVFPETEFFQRSDPIKSHQTPNKPTCSLKSNCIGSSSSTPVYAPLTLPADAGARMYPQQPILVRQPQTSQLHVAGQQGVNIQASAMTAQQPSFTQTHQVRNVQVFSGGPDCKILIEDWVRDMQYLLDAGGMPANLCFATIVRHLSGEARRLVLNLPPYEQTVSRAFEELRAEYSEMQTSHDPLADFYERCQRPGESACSYAIALEAALRSVEEVQHGGQPFPDRDGKLTRQFMRGLSDEEVYQRLAPMKPRLLSFRELQAELRNLARETRRTQTQPKAKKTYAQAQFTTSNGAQNGENMRTEKVNKQNNDLTELTALVKKLLSSQEDQVNRLTKLEARVGVSPQTVHPRAQRSQGVSDTAERGVVCYRCGKPGHIARLCRTMLSDEAAQAENGAGTRQDLNV